MSIEDEKLSIFMVKFIDKCKDIQKDFTDLSPYNQMRAEKIIDQVIRLANSQCLSNIVRFMH